MTIADLIQSTIDSSKERIKTPITGAFICSFIIYNWQPILILFFSDSSIECRIIIAKTYFNAISFLWPLGMALLFTVLIPLLMWGLDTINIFAKKKRLATNFQNKKNLINEKMNIADDVNKLKHKESGNKEIQELLDRITYLEETNNQLNSSNKNTVDQLNSSLKEANNSLAKVNKELLDNLTELEKLKQEKIEEQQWKRRTAQKIYNNFSILEQQSFKSMINKSGIFEAQRVPNSTIETFIKKGIIENTETGLALTELGRSIWLETIFTS